MEAGQVGLARQDTIELGADGAPLALDVFGPGKMALS